MPISGSSIAGFNPDASPRRVLIVDASADSRSVLRTALEHRGLEVFAAAGARQGLELARQHHPEVIVLDLEAESADEADVQADFDSAAETDQAAIVVLGRARFLRPLPAGQVVPKPYHYGPLIHKIEALAANRASEDLRRSA